MKTFFPIFLASALLIMSSCKRKSVESFDKFPVSYILKGEKADDNFIFKAAQIDVFDSLLIITSTPQTIQSIHIFNKNTFQHIISVGDVGKGPSEIMVPGLACIDKLNGIIWYRDMGHQKIWEFDINKILTEEKYKPIQSVPLPPDHFFIQFESTENLFSFANTDKNVFISYFNQKGQIIDSLTVKDRINIYEKTDDESRKFTSNYQYADHPSKHLHAIAYRFADVFAIIGQDGNVISSVKGPDHFLQTPEYDNLNLTEAYTDIRSNEKFIYCLYSGEKRMEEKDGEMVANHAKKLHIFNWEGKPVASINLDYSVMSFDIDEKENRLITFSHETGGVVYYQMPPL